jgi:etoposide-induced 2.4 mRNA
VFSNNLEICTSDVEVRTNVLKSLLLNALSLASIYTFDFLLLFIFPHGQQEQQWLHRNIGWFYNILWVLPVVGVSLYLNSTWSYIIAKRSFNLQHGSRNHHFNANAPKAATTYNGLLNQIATSVYRTIMVCTSVAISFFLRMLPLPYFGTITGFLFFCWVDAYYCFEFVWIAKGMSLSRRVRHLEERWAYYLAFGMPSTLLCTWSSSLANAAIFALVFPAYIIMATHARPVPLDPYKPSTNMIRYGEDSSINGPVIYPSPFIPVRLPVFAPVLWLNDRIIGLLNVMGGGTSVSSSIRQERLRSPELDVTESGGEIVEMDNLRGEVRRPVVGQRFKIGNRKFD